MAIVNTFSEVGRAMRARWERCHLDEDRFPEVASELLREGLSGQAFQAADVLDALAASLATDGDATAVRAGSPFGSSLEVYRDPHFFIEVLTWVDGTTAVHEHSFAGAFLVLAGSSLLSSYRFVPSRRYNQYLQVGRTELGGVEVLQAGDVRPIHAGARSAHSLFHLARPSLTVVARTHDSASHPRQLDYLPCGIAYDPFRRDPVHDAVVRALEVKDLVQRGSALEAARRFISRGDPWLAFRVAEYAFASWDRAQYLALLDSPAPGADEVFDRLRASVHQRYRSRSIVHRRATITKDTHRFFMALLLNLPDRDRVLQVVADRFPGRDPRDTIVDWIRELGATPSTVPGEDNAIDFPITRVALDFMRRFLAGATLDEAIDGLRARYGNVDEYREGLATLGAKLRDPEGLFGVLATSPGDG